MRRGFLSRRAVGPRLVVMIRRTPGLLFAQLATAFASPTAPMTSTIACLLSLLPRARQTYDRPMPGRFADLIVKLSRESCLFNITHQTDGEINATLVFFPDINLDLMISPSSNRLARTWREVIRGADSQTPSIVNTIQVGPPPRRRIVIEIVLVILHSGF